MSLRRLVIKRFAKKVHNDIQRMSRNALVDQASILKRIIKKAEATKFGEDHQFAEIFNYADFKQAVPIREYEDLKSYVELIINGQSNVLWPGFPKYLAKTSGTTSGVKYIPITKESIRYHIKTARNTILNYVNSADSDVFSNKMIFLSGSPTLSTKGHISTGRLSGIVNHEVPSWFRPNQLPSMQTNCIEDWESKLDKIVAETVVENMSVISGIPPWVQMYYERLLEKTGKINIKEVFPNLKLFVHGGVNFKPYKQILDKLHGEKIDTLETYPASEGFIAFQDNLADEGLLLNTNAGMFFEFVEPQFIADENPKRLVLSQVEENVDYALIISTNAGLWAYNIGDIIRFTSLDPYKVIVSGRIKHFISAFGEHVISKEVEEAMNIVSTSMNVIINEFTVAPNINPENDEIAHHEWLIEFENPPDNIEIIAKALDKEICRQNIYYKDLIDGHILKPLKISPLKLNSFREYMKTLGKLGGQNKVPRLTNDRKIADALQFYRL